ncbi:MAG TPA: CHAT domain-containing protein [Thermoanaerobaculia bacterium]|nr:CHAT domain-containing protein [Thermoanaerobaculia bacterium]
MLRLPPPAGCFALAALFLTTGCKAPPQPPEEISCQAERADLAAAQAQGGLPLAEAQQGLAKCLRDLERWDEAEAAYRQALATYQQLPGTAKQPGLEGKIVSNLGVVLWAQNHPDMARAVLLEGRARLHQAGDKLGESSILISLGNLEQLYGQWTEPVAQRFLGAIELAKSAGNEPDAPGLQQEGWKALGYLYWSISRQDPRKLDPETLGRAEAAFEAALRLGAPANDPAVLRGLAGVQELRGELRQAARTYESLIREIGREPGSLASQAAFKVDLASLDLRLEKLHEATSLLEEALRVLEPLPEPQWQFEVSRALSVRARVEEGQGKLQDALGSIRHVIELDEALRRTVADPSLRQSLAASRRKRYELAVAIADHLNQASLNQASTAEAFGFSELARARGFADLLDRANITLPAEALASAAPPTLERLQQDLLKPGDAVLEYIVGEERSFLLVVTRHGAALRPLAGGPGSLSSSTLTAQVERLQKAILARADPMLDPAYTEPAVALFRGLISPAAELLEGVDHLIVIPDDSLYRLPFETLLEREPRLGDAGAPFLVKRYRVSYLPSVTVWAQIEAELNQRLDRSTPGPRYAFVGFGDPQNRSEREATVVAQARAGQPAVGAPAASLPRLPGSEGELRTISALLAPSAVKLFLGKQATKVAVTGPGSVVSDTRFLHFAVHGDIEGRSKDQLALVLAPTSPQDDGRLRMQDVLGLSLRCDLVVLSACGSGLGEQLRGEGVIGFSRAFMQAGTPSLLMSLWNVDDVRTAQLMERFYGRLLAGASKAEALRQAKLDLLDQPGSADPFYWAPFILFGRSE